MPADAAVVRPATPNDIARIASIRDGDSESGPADARMRLYLEGRHHPQKALLPRAIFFATIEHETVGYIGGHLTRRFDCEGELQYLYVAPRHRRAGVASALVRRLAAWFLEQKVRRVCVNVDTDSPGAEAFYCKHGARALQPHWMVWEDIGVASAASPHQRER